MYIYTGRGHWHGRRGRWHDLSTKANNAACKTMHSRATQNKATQGKATPSNSIGNALCSGSGRLYGWSLPMNVVDIHTYIFCSATFSCQVHCRRGSCPAQGQFLARLGTSMASVEKIIENQFEYARAMVQFGSCAQGTPEHSELMLDTGSKILAAYKTAKTISVEEAVKLQAKVASGPLSPEQIQMLMIARRYLPWSHVNQMWWYLKSIPE